MDKYFISKIRNTQGVSKKHMNRWWKRFIHHYTFVGVDEDGFLYVNGCETSIKATNPRLVKKWLQKNPYVWTEYE